MIPDLSAYPLTPPLTEFSLSGAGINNRVMGIRSGDGDFVWKLYQTHADPAAIRYEHRLLTWLAQRELSFAVPAPVSTVDGDTLVSTAEGWGALFPLLPGAPPDHCQIEQIRAVGAALGELHCALVDYTLVPHPHFHSYGDLRHVHPTIPDPFALTLADLGLPAAPDLIDLLARWQADLAELDEFTRCVYIHLPLQMTHGDYVPSNTLFHAGRLTAILDFEMAQPDVRAIDMASGLEFSLRIWDRRDPLAFGAAFWQGYTGWVQPSADEIAAIPMLIRLRDAVSVLWWLGRGNISGGVQRIRNGTITKQWLEENGDEMMGMMR
ncbi:MAG: phosphotransferase [Caldilineaceae bacterium]|nr:phosphotransferase [Caldilineaceae bacterium]